MRRSLLPGKSEATRNAVRRWQRKSYDTWHPRMEGLNKESVGAKHGMHTTVCFPTPSSVHLDPPPRLLDIPLPALRKRYQLRPFQNSMIPTPSYRTSNHRFHPAFLYLRLVRFQSCITHFPFHLPLGATDGADCYSSAWWEDGHGPDRLAEGTDRGDDEVCGRRGTGRVLAEGGEVGCDGG